MNTNSMRTGSGAAHDPARPAALDDRVDRRCAGRAASSRAMRRAIVAVTRPTRPWLDTTGIPDRTASPRPRSSSTERNHGETSWPTTWLGRSGTSKSLRMRRDPIEMAARDERFAEWSVLFLEFLDSRAQRPRCRPTSTKRDVGRPDLAEKIDRTRNRLRSAVRRVRAARSRRPRCSLSERRRSPSMKRRVANSSAPKSSGSRIRRKKSRMVPHPWSRGRPHATATFGGGI